MVKKLLPFVPLLFLFSFTLSAQEKDKEPVKEMRLERITKIGSTDSPAAAETAPIEFPNDNSKLKKLPKVGYPAEARSTGLEGVVRVPVRVSSAGDVLDVGEPLGPDTVCSNVKRPDVLALRTAAKAAAAKVVVDPSKLEADRPEQQLMIGVRFTTPAGVKKDEGGLSIGARVEPDDSHANTPTTAARVVGDAPTNTVSGGVLNGRALSLPKPSYPSAARAVRASGTVTIQVEIDTDGTTFRAWPVSGHPLLRHASEISACSSTFSPTLLLGQPVRVTGVITYNFIP